MTTIPSAIASLLYDHDTVIVPGLGAFVRCDQSARVNVITNEFQRPSSTLAFDPQQREENALVSNYLMACDGLSDEEARKVIATFVGDCFAQLKETGTVSLPEIGTLSFDEQHDLAFVPANGADFNSDAFGLGDFSPRPVYGTKKEEQKPQELPELTPMQDTEDLHGDSGSGRGKWWILLLLLLLVAAGVALWYFKFREVPTKPWPPQRPQHETPTLVVPSDTLAVSKDTLETRKDTLTAPADTLAVPTDTLVVTSETTHEISPVAPPEVAPENVPTAKGIVKVVAPDAASKAFIVGGCFSIEQNALNMTAEILEQGCASAFVMKRGTKFYVCYGQYNSTSDAKAALPEVLSKYNSKAWILTK